MIIAFNTFTLNETKVENLKQLSCDCLTTCDEYIKNKLKDKLNLDIQFVNLKDHSDKEFTRIGLGRDLYRLNDLTTKFITDTLDDLVKSIEYYVSLELQFKTYKYLYLKKDVSNCVLAIKTTSDDERLTAIIDYLLVE